jgi:hypothetical protein
MLGNAPKTLSIWFMSFNFIYCSSNLIFDSSYFCKVPKIIFTVCSSNTCSHARFCLVPDFFSSWALPFFRWSRVLSYLNGVLSSVSFLLFLQIKSSKRHGTIWSLEDSEELTCVLEGADREGPDPDRLRLVLSFPTILWILCFFSGSRPPLCFFLVEMEETVLWE